MPTVPLPSDPSLVQLRKRARELKRRWMNGDPAALGLLDEHYPGGDVTGFPLHLAQLVLARVHGFGSWPRLVEHLRAAGDLSRSPDRESADGSTVDRFLSHAVLRYGGDDGPARWAVAAALLAQDPALGPSDIYTAAATADHVAVHQFLTADPSSARTAGGPFRWEPLLYLAYSRLPVGLADVLTTAGLLLQAGADPNAGYLWHGLPTPFTVLTGVFGSGELGMSNQPPHPHALPLARLLLEAGADANDGQALYNRMFEPDNAYLRLLFDYGLGRGDGGPWHHRLPEVTDSPARLVRLQLSWAVSHGFLDRIRLLAAHGVDLESPLTLGNSPLSTADTPIGLALRSGQAAAADLLRDLGAAEPDLDPGTRLVGALLAGDAVAVAGAPAALLAKVRRRHPALILRAVSVGSSSGLELLLANGFDVNALGRHDVPVDQEWETALHFAAGEGDVDLLRRLLAAGADPSVTDRRFQATALGWAEHFDHVEAVELLRTVTPAS